MHISQTVDADANVVAAWVLAASDAVRNAVERATGMSGGAPAALVAIVADPGLSIDELRRVLGLTHPGTVRLVDRLVDRGWVMRRPGTGRTVHLMPTAAGRRTEHRLVAARGDAMATILHAVPRAQLRQLARTVGPMLAERTIDLDSRRRLCRLCDRPACTDCPVRNAPI